MTSEKTKELLSMLLSIPSVQAPLGPMVHLDVVLKVLRPFVEGKYVVASDADGRLGVQFQEPEPTSAPIPETLGETKARLKRKSDV